MTDQPRIIATIDAAAGYDGLIAMFRARIVELGTSMLAIDAVAMLPDGYTAKVLSPAPIKGHKGRGLGPDSYGALMQATGVKFLVIEDWNPIMAKLELRSEKGPKIDAGQNAGLRKARIGQIARTKQILISCAGQRSNIARIAANARWAVYRKHQARLAVRRAKRRQSPA